MRTIVTTCSCGDGSIFIYGSTGQQRATTWDERQVSDLIDNKHRREGEPAEAFAGIRAQASFTLAFWQRTTAIAGTFNEMFLQCSTSLIIFFQPITVLLTKHADSDSLG